MAWQTPKTDYDSLYIVGSGDLNRIESNTQWLKDEIAKDGLFVLPSDTVILQANTERSRHVTEPAKTVKKFWLKYAGIYRIYYELQPGYGMSAIVNFKANSTISSPIFSIRGDNTTSWVVYNFDVFLPPGPLEIQLTGACDPEWSWGPASYIRNVKLKGTLMTRSQIPNNAVLLD